MTNNEARWWLLGFFELCDKPFDRRMLFVIRNHLNLVKAVEGELDEINASVYSRIDVLLSQDVAADALSLFHAELGALLIHHLRTEPGMTKE